MLKMGLFYMNKANFKNHISSYDGLRALALLGVVFYHLMPDVVPGGFLGVVVFFVMAGYLTMRKTISFDDKKKKASPIIQLLKRLKKLMPPLTFMVIIVVIIMAAFYPQFLKSLRLQAIGSILGFNNIAQIMTGESYFESFGFLKPITHIWALSLEMQFYLVFYLLVYPFFKNKKAGFWTSLFLVLSLCSIASMFFIYSPGNDPSRAYYGLDTRLVSFLFGMIAAILTKTIKFKFNVIIKNFILLILLVMIIIPMFRWHSDSFTFYFGFVIYSFITALFLLLLHTQNTIVSKVLSFKPFKYLASRSYSIYLWHYPILKLLEKTLAHYNISFISFSVIFIIITLIISEISYIFTEKQMQKKWRSEICIPAIIAMTLAITAFPYDVLANGNEKLGELNNFKEELTNKEKEIQDKINAQKLEQAKNEAAETTTVTANETVTAKPKEKTPTINVTDDPKLMEVLDSINRVNEMIGNESVINADDYIKYRNLKFCLIGDSLSTISINSLYDYMPAATIDAAGCRQLTESVDIFNSLKSQNLSGDAVVLALGTNASNGIDTNALEQIYNAADGKPVLLVNIVLPYATQEAERNSSIMSFINTHENTYLVDWHSHMKARPEFFIEDNIHPKDDGCNIFAQLIMAKIIELKKNGTM